MIWKLSLPAFARRRLLPTYMDSIQPNCLNGTHGSPARRANDSPSAGREMMTCPKCHWFLGKIKYWAGAEQNIDKVIGTCKRHGEVEPQDWQWEDIFGWD